MKVELIKQIKANVTGIVRGMSKQDKAKQITYLRALHCIVGWPDEESLEELENNSKTMLEFLQESLAKDKALGLRPDMVEGKKLAQDEIRRWVRMFLLRSITQINRRDELMG